MGQPGKAAALAVLKVLALLALCLASAELLGGSLWLMLHGP